MTQYKPFEYSVRIVMRAQKRLDEMFDEGSLAPYMAKSDLKSAFRFGKKMNFGFLEDEFHNFTVQSIWSHRYVPIRKQDWKWLVMMAEHPVSGEKFYFFDKALPFGSSR